MNYASYKALCADPVIQADFMEKLTAEVTSAPQNERYSKLKSLVTVAGAPFDVPKYLVTLGTESDGWDADEVGEPAMRRLTAAANELTAACPDVNPGNFIFRFEDMPGANADLVAARAGMPEHDIAVGVLAMSARLNAASETFRNPLELERAPMR